MAVFISSGTTPVDNDWLKMEVMGAARVATYPLNNQVGIGFNILWQITLKCEMDFGGYTVLSTD